MKKNITLVGIVILIALVGFLIRNSVKKAQNTFLLPLYQAEVSKHPSTLTVPSCAKLNFKTNELAEKSQKAITLENPSVNEPNFAGGFLLLKTQGSTTAEWFIADCKTGNFFPNTFPAGDLYFLRTSNAAVMNPPAPTDTVENYRTGAYGIPKVLVWTDARWSVIPNLIQK